MLNTTFFSYQAIRDLFYRYTYRLLAKKPIFLSKLYRYIVTSYRDPSIKGIIDSLVNVGYSEEEAISFAKQASSFELIKNIEEYRYYKTNNVPILQERFRRIPLLDEKNLLLKSIFDENSILAVLHSGLYWESVAKIIALSEKKKDFVILILKDQAGVEESLNVIRPLCKSLDIIITGFESRRSAVFKVVRAVNKGKKLIIFPDLPSNLGSLFMGAPKWGKFMGKNAAIASGAIDLAKLLGKDITYVTQEMDVRSGDKSIVCIDRVASEHVSIQSNLDILDKVVRKSPHLWSFLPKMEIFFQMQLNEAESEKINRI